MSRSLPAAPHRVARPPAPRLAPESMTLLLFPGQHPLAGTSCARRCTSFIPASASAGRTPQTSSQSARRRRRQSPVRNHQRLSALSNLHKTVCRQPRCRDKSPYTVQRSPLSRGFFLPRLSDAGLIPDRPLVLRPASETLQGSGHQSSSTTFSRKSLPRWHAVTDAVETFLDRRESRLDPRLVLM